MPTKSPQKTAIIYARTSTDTQKQDQTIDGQIVACETIVNRDNLRVIETIVDDGVSGTQLEDRNFKQLIYDLESGIKQTDFIVVRNFDRILRVDQNELKSKIDAQIIEHSLSKAKTKIVDLNETIDPSNVIMWFFKRYVAQQDRTNLLDKMRFGRISSIDKSNYPFGQYPFGYAKKQMPDKRYRLVANDEETAKLKRLFYWVANFGAKYAHEQILKEGWAKRRNGNKKTTSQDPWSTKTVKNIVNGAEIYANGYMEITIGGKSMQLELPILLTFAEIEAARNGIKLHDKAYSAKSSALLTGFLKCRCGCLIVQTHVNRDGKRAYIPAHSRYGITDCEYGHQMLQAVIHPFIGLVCVNRLFEIAMSKPISDKNGIEELTYRLAKIDDMIAEKKAEILRLYSDKNGGKLPEDIAFEEIGKANKNRTALMAEREMVKKAIKNFKEKTVDKDSVKDQAALLALKSAIGTDEEKRLAIAKLLGDGRIITWKKDGIIFATMPAYDSLKEKTYRSDAVEEIKSATAAISEMLKGKNADSITEMVNTDPNLAKFLLDVYRNALQTKIEAKKAEIETTNAELASVDEEITARLSFAANFCPKTKSAPPQK